MKAVRKSRTELLRKAASPADALSQVLRLGALGIQLTCDEVATAFATTAGPTSLPDQAYTYLAGQLENSRWPPDGRGASELLYGTRFLSDSAGVRQVLRSVTAQLRRVTSRMDAQAVGNALYGLQRRQGSQQTVRELTAALVPLVMSCQEPLDERAIGAATHGLRGQDAKTAESRALVSAAAGCLASTLRVTKSVSPRTAAAAVTGISNLVDGVEARALLARTAALVARCAALDARSVAECMHGLRNQSETPRSVALLSALTGPVTRCPEPLTARAVGASLFGIQGFSGCRAVRVFLLRLAPAVLGASSADAVSASHALYGMNRQSTKPESSVLLEAVAKWLSTCTDRIGAGSLCMCLYGLREQRSSEAVHYVLYALLRLAAPKEGVADSKALAMALFGLQGQRTGVGCVRDIVVVLAEQARRSAACVQPGGGFTNHGVVTALTGMRNFEDNTETRLLLPSLAVLVGKNSTPFDGTTTASALYGMRCFVDSPAVRELLGALLPRVGGPLRSAEVGLSLYGMRALSQSENSRAMLRTLVPLAKGVSVLAPEDAARAFHGLQGQGAAPEVTSFLVLLREKMLWPPRIDPHDFNLIVRALLALNLTGAAGAEAMVREFVRWMPADDSEGVTAAVYAQTLALVGLTAKPVSASAAGADGLYEGAIRELLESCNVAGVLFGVTHDSGFDMDMLCPETAVNIELDGVSGTYGRTGNIQMRRARDEMLRSKYGIKVFRVTIGSHRPLPEIALELQELLDEHCWVFNAQHNRRRWQKVHACAQRGWNSLLQVSRWRQREAARLQETTRG